MSCGVGLRCGLDPELLWCRPAATAPIRPLAWEPPYATEAAQETAKRLKKKKKKEKKSMKGTSIQSMFRKLEGLNRNTFK